MYVQNHQEKAVPEPVISSGPVQLVNDLQHFEVHPAAVSIRREAEGRADGVTRDVVDKVDRRVRPPGRRGLLRRCETVLCDEQLASFDDVDGRMCVATDDSRGDA